MDPIHATYLLSASAENARRRAEDLALEQTIELPAGVRLDEFVENQVLGRVERVATADGGIALVEIAYPSGSQDGSAAQLLNVLFGNSSMHPDVALVDATIPDWLACAFPGPQFGVAGWRRLTGTSGRAFTCTALKPQGLETETLAGLCETFARAGIDVIKDDHGLSDQKTAPFDERVRACQRSVERVFDETGHRAIYAPNLIGGPKTVRRRLELAVDAGVRAVMVEPMLLGLPAFAELIASEPGVLVIAHPSFSGGARITPDILLGTLFRLFGADAVIYPHEGGRFEAFNGDTCREIARRLREDRPGLSETLPVPAGGMQLENAGSLVEFYGVDCMLLIGGSLYLAGDDLLEHARRFVRSVEEATRGGVTD